MINKGLLLGSPLFILQLFPHLKERALFKDGKQGGNGMGSSAGASLGGEPVGFKNVHDLPFFFMLKTQKEGSPPKGGNPSFLPHGGGI